MTWRMLLFNSKPYPSFVILLLMEQILTLHGPQLWHFKENTPNNNLQINNNPSPYLFIPNSQPYTIRHFVSLSLIPDRRSHTTWWKMMTISSQTVPLWTRNASSGHGSLQPPPTSGSPFPTTWYHTFS